MSSESRNSISSLVVGEEVMYSAVRDCFMQLSRMFALLFMTFWVVYGAGKVERSQCSL